MDAVGESLGHLRADFQDEKQHAHESRAVIHHRLDQQAGKIGHLETTVALSGQIDAQLRDTVTTLDDTVKRNYAAVVPALDDWKRVKFLGWGMAGIFLALGISAASVYAWAWEWAKTALRYLLRIN